jgi:hypothetical protein
VVVSARLTHEMDRRRLLRLAMRGLGSWVRSRAARTADDVPTFARPLLRVLVSRAHTGDCGFLLDEARARWEATEVMTWLTSNS